MPTPRKNEKKSDFVSRCIPIAMDEGMPQKQAVAYCYSLFEQKKKKSKGSIFLENGDEILIEDSPDNS